MEFQVFKMIKCPFSNFSATTAFKIRDTVICWTAQAELSMVDTSERI